MIGVLINQQTAWNFHHDLMKLTYMIAEAKFEACSKEG